MQERNTSNHSHEWEFEIENWTGAIYAHCSECKEYMDNEELLRRLNATECLPGWAAEQFGWGQRLNFGPKQQGYKICDMLIAYAEAMDDHDEA